MQISGTPEHNKNSICQCTTINEHNWKDNQTNSIGQNIKNIALTATTLQVVAIGTAHRHRLNNNTNFNRYYFSSDK